MTPASSYVGSRRVSFFPEKINISGQKYPEINPKLQLTMLGSPAILRAFFLAHGIVWPRQNVCLATHSNTGVCVLVCVWGREGVFFSLRGKANARYLIIFRSSGENTNSSRGINEKMRFPHPNSRAVRWLSHTKVNKTTFQIQFF